jgi:hypothetical protein
MITPDAAPAGTGNNRDGPESIGFFALKAVGELKRRLKVYDRMRVNLEQKGGNLSDLRAISTLLSEAWQVKTPWVTHQALLTCPADLKRTLAALDNSLFFEVRNLSHTKMPVYYLGRLGRDAWGEYSLVVQEHYLSKGYPMPDSRFARIMRSGKERYFLRMAGFRPQLAQLLGIKPGLKDAKAAEHLDHELYKLGRGVFQAAWHHDQQLAVKLANAFGLVDFGYAIELLYLCLGGDLCYLRANAGKYYPGFFKDVYPQPAIKGLWIKLKNINGKGLAELPKAAKDCYGQLSRAFSGLLQNRAGWGPDAHGVPFWKLVYANVERLDMVAKRLENHAELKDNLAYLENQAGQVIKRLILG